LIDIIPLAFLSALYPTLLAVVVLVLQRPDPRRLLAAYLAGAMLTSMVVGYAIVTALREGNAVGGNNEVGPWVNIAGGLVALLLVWFLAGDWGKERRRRMKAKKDAKRSASDRPPWSERVIQRGSVTLTFVVGMALNLPGAMYLVALKDVAQTDLTTAETIGALLAYNVIMFQWAEVPLIGYAVAPERTKVLITRMNHWLRDHALQLGIVICSIAAAFLLTRGVFELL